MVTGFKYVLVILDKFTRWVILVPLKDMKAKTIVNAFVEQVIFQHGFPEKTLTDRGSQFTSDMFLRLMERFGIEKLFTTSFHPSYNGQPEI